MIPEFLTTGKNVNCMGMPMNQNRLAVPCWSYAMEVYPPMRIIELGSYNGGFAIALGAHARRIGCHTYSFDVCKCPTEGWEMMADFLNVKFYQVDVFSIEADIGKMIGRAGTTYLLCDNGNKIKEVNTFAKYLKPGDVIAGHDYFTDHWQVGSEIRPEAVAETVAACGLTRWMPEVFDLCGWLVYRKA